MNNKHIVLGPTDLYGFTFARCNIANAQSDIQFLLSAYNEIFVKPKWVKINSL